MDKIGITGLIATGKTSVATVLAGQQLACLDCDSVVARLYQSPEVKDIIQSRFGYSFFTPGGSLDQKKLGAFAFEHEPVLHWLEQILWPRVSEQVALWLFGQQKKGLPVAFVFGTHLVASGIHTQIDELWQLTSQRELVLERVQARYHLSRLQAATRRRLSRDPMLTSQNVTLVIENYDTIPQLQAQIIKLIRQRGW
ncbi:dephospho-CoA kinase [bacterium]|nr:dephospho-CoA kinase [bacterium]